MEINNKYPRPELLLHGNIIKPLHGLNPRTLLGQEYWPIHKSYEEWKMFYSSK